MSEKIEPNVLEKISDHLRAPTEEDRVFPKNKKIEVVFLVEAVNAILPRTEGVEDITLLKLPGTDIEVPVILPEKLQAVARRRMLAQLRVFRDKNGELLRRHLEALASIYKYPKKKRGKEIEEVIVGFKKAKVNDPSLWNCYIQPPGGEAREATDEGMDGFCPSCALFGAILDRNKLSGVGQNVAIGIKSRVEFDPAFAFLDQEKTVASYTHNKVSGGVSWTGQGLFEERHVVPGTVFVGKVTLEDVTKNELKAFLAVLSSIDRLGGRERIFGGVRIELVGLRGGSYETISALEIAKQLSKLYKEKETLPDVKEVFNRVDEIISKIGFMPLKTADFKGLLDNMDMWNDLWEDTVEYDKQVVKRVLELVRGSYEAA